MTKPAPSSFRMGEVGRHSVVYLVGAIAAKAVGFLLLPIYTRLLTPADYGVLQLVELSIEIVSILAGSRLAAGIYHFYHKSDDDLARRQVLASAFGVMVVAFSLAGLAAFAMAPWIAELVLKDRAGADYVRIASLTLVVQGFHVAPNAMLQLQRRSGTVVSLSLVRLGIQVVLNLLFLIRLDMGVRGVLLSALIANAVIGAWLTRELFVTSGWHFARWAAKDIVRFGAPLIGTHAAKFFVSYGDRYVLQATSGPAAVGIYGLAYQFAHLVFTLAAAPHRAVWDAARFDAVKRPERDQLFARAFVQHNVVQVALGVAICLFIPELLRVMTTPPFRPAAQWVPVLTLAFIMYSWSFFLNIGMYVKEKPHLITRNAWIGAIVAVAGYVALVPLLDGLGAALANLLSYAVLAWLTYAESQRLLPIRYNWPAIWRLLLLGSAVSATGYAIPPLDLPLAIAAKAMLLGAFAFACYHIGVLTDGEKELVRLLFRSPRRGLALLRGR